MRTHYIKSLSEYLKRYKPCTPSLRHTVLINRNKLWSGSSLKTLCYGLSCRYRKNGRIVFRTRGGGNRKKYRSVDFSRRHNFGVPGIVTRLEYDPNRSSFISLVLLLNNVCFYVLASYQTDIGCDVFSSLNRIPVFSSSQLSSFLKFMYGGCLLYSLELLPSRGCQMVRSAGGYGVFLRFFKYGNRVVIRFRSGQARLFPLNCFGTMGVVSNIYFRSVSLGKAGRGRWLGNRPIVRGVAMNPIDHPHGGGEGKKSNKAVPRTPWGLMLKWRSTSRSVTKRW